MTQEEMDILVPQKLKEIEEQQGVTVLLAVESGSRAWGFASPDSDFDVRFIYKRPLNGYLQLNRPRDVIELPVDNTWDVSGWDLDKTLRLLYKSNPTLFEWANSLLCYLQTEFSARLVPLLSEYLSVKNALYHYLNAARSDVSAYLKGEMVRPKKYFYALREVLACLWVLENRTPPPVLFSELADAMLPDSLRPPLEYLLDIKLNSPEKALIKPVGDIDSFLDTNISRLDEVMKNLPKENPRSWDLLNDFFISEITETF